MWYFDTFQMYQILETKIMNQYIIEKWSGNVVINSTIEEQSCAGNIIYGKDNNLTNKPFRIFHKIIS